MQNPDEYFAWVMLCIRRAESVEHLGGILEQFNFLHARIFQHQSEEIMRAALERETQVTAKAATS